MLHFWLAEETERKLLIIKIFLKKKKKRLFPVLAWKPLVSPDSTLHRLDEEGKAVEKTIR